MPETLAHVAVERAEQVALLRMEIEGFGDRPAPDHVVGQPNLGQHVHAVRRDLQAAADAGGMRPGLEYLGLDADAPQQDRGDGPGNAGADDERFAGSLGHVLLLMSQGVKKVHR